MKNTKFFLLLFLASITTLTSVAMVASNAVTHGVTWDNKMLLSLLAIVICLCAHLVLALSKRRAAWLLWCACLIATMYSQLSYFTNVSTVAGKIRARNSVEVANSTRQIESIKQALSQVRARPVTVVARDLSKSKNDKRIAALNVELEEARRAEKLQDILIGLESNAVTIQSTESKDPLISLLESVTHIGAAIISITTGTTFAFVLEMLAVFLWCELLSKSQPEIPVSPELAMPEILTSPEDEKLATVKHAIASGQIRQTVTAIRKYLRCGQDKAVSIHKLLVNHRGNVTQSFQKSSAAS